MADYDYDPETGEILDPPKDPAIEAAKAVMMEAFFQRDATEVYYGRQLEVLLEDQFFHWITKKALNELAASGMIAMTVESSKGNAQFDAHFYAPLRYRYPRRKIGEMMSIISEYSEPSFAHAVGIQGENLADIGFAEIGFRILDRDVQSVDGIEWTATNHDLDRLIVRDGVLYGVEIKNRLTYIHPAEFRAKLEMCRHLGIRPLFIARMMPRTYIYDVAQAGGFSLILKDQQYPLLGGDLMRRVRERLGLPVAAVRTLPNTTLARFERWHERQIGM